MLTAWLLVLAVAAAPAAAAPLWGELEAGPHAVGYRTVSVHDLSRPAYAGTPAPGRPMQVHLWYPAKASRAPLRYGDYVALQAQELTFGPLTDAARREAIRRFAADHGGDAERLAALLDVATTATRDATPAPGRFPLVIFAHSAPPHQGIMSEYLASHGFLVAATLSKGSFEYAFDVGLTGLETMVKDMEFVLASAARAPEANPNRLGLIGMSFGSAGVVAFHTRHPEVRAMVSLDGGIGEGGVSHLLTRTPYYDVARIRAPLLHLYTPDNPHLDLARIESYKHSTRYLAAIPRMRHGDFVGFGMLERLAPGLFGAAPRDAVAGFEWACRYTLRFLRAFLEGDAGSLAFVQRRPEANGVPVDLMAMTVKASLPLPPSLPELKEAFEREGFARLAALYVERRAQDAQPFTHASFLQLTDWLLARNQAGVAGQLGALFLESYPASARAHHAAAGAAERAGDAALARRHYREALKLLGDDPDLDFRARKRLEQATKDALARLK